MPIAPNGWHCEHDDGNWWWWLSSTLLILLPWWRLGRLPERLPQLLLPLATTDVSNCHVTTAVSLATTAASTCKKLLPIATWSLLLLPHFTFSLSPSQCGLFQTMELELSNTSTAAFVRLGEAENTWQVTFDWGTSKWFNLKRLQIPSHINWQPDWNELERISV